MKTKQILIWMLVLCAAWFCAGCGSVTPEQAAEKMDQALAGKPCTQMEMVMDMKMTVEMEGAGSVAIGMKMTEEAVMQQTPAANYTSVQMEMNVLGQTVQTAAETYIVPENGGLAAYVNSDGMWLRMDTSVTAEQLAQTASAVAYDRSNLAIDEEVKEYQGTKAICLTTQVSSDGLEAMLGAAFQEMTEDNAIMEEAADTVNDVDWSAVSGDVRIYVDAETYLPIAEEMTLSGLDAAMASVLGEMEAAVSVDNCTAVFTYASYETKESIELPDGAQEKAAAWARLLADNPDNGDGTYTIREGLALIDITVPEGFIVKKTEYDTLELEQDGNNRKISYIMYYVDDGEDTTGTYFTNYVDSYEHHCITAYEETTEREQKRIAADTLEYYCDFLTTTSYNGREQAQYYAWYPVMSDQTGATYYLYVEVVDGYGSGLVGGDESPADITEEEFISYLNAADKSSLMDS